MLALFSSIITSFFSSIFSSFIIFDILKLFFSWGSLSQAIIATFLILTFRGIEKMLGSNIFLVLLSYNFLIYIIPWIVILFINGSELNLPLITFVPFGLFIYCFWEIPSLSIFPYLSDKVIVCLFMILFGTYSFPYSFIPLITGIISLILFHYNCFKLRNYIKVIPNDEFSEEEVSEEEYSNRRSDEDQLDHNNNNLDSLIQMGFDVTNARHALRINPNLTAAIDYLLQSASL